MNLCLKTFSIALALSFSLTTSADVDNRKAQSPVRNQLSRGTCSAFAVAGALESMPGIPTELSVQYLYAVMKKTQIQQGQEASEGDALSKYVPVLQNYGVPAEHFLPYNGSPDDDSLFCQFYRQMMDPTARLNMSFLCHARITDDQFLKTSPYGKYHLSSDTEILGAGEVTNVERIKAILDEQGLGKWVRSIPVSYKLIPSQWGNSLNGGRMDIWDSSFTAHVQTTTGSLAFSAETAKATAAVQYGWDMSELLRQGWVTFSASNPNENWAGHAVQIVGYDSTGFIIKNSWGTSWGDQGYGHISYDYHRAMATEALIIRGAWAKMPTAETSFSYFTDFRLKSYYDPEAGYLSLSTYSMEIEDPFLYRAEYQLLTRNSQGQWVEFGSPFVSAPFETPEYWRQGYGGDFNQVFNASIVNLAVRASYFTPSHKIVRYFYGVGAAGMHDLQGSHLPVN